MSDPNSRRQPCIESIEPVSEGYSLTVGSLVPRGYRSRLKETGAARTRIGGTGALLDRPRKGHNWTAARAPAFFKDPQVESLGNDWRGYFDI